MLTLVNSALLGMIALAAIPLLVHLFARTRPPVYAFSSVEFLRKIVRTTMRVKKPRDILLLILRTLAVLCLILVFLRPLLFTDKRLSGGGGRKNVVLVIDATASMAYVDGAQSRFAAACAKGAEVLDGLGTNDRANVVWIKANPEAVFPELGTAHAFLADSLRQARVTDEPGGFRNALALAASHLEGSEGSREIWILSDFQSSQWKDPALAAPAEVSLVTVPVGEGEAPNMALSRLECEPRRALVGEESNVLCEVRNFSPQPRRSKVYLEAGEVRQTQDVMVEPWSSATAAFTCRFTAAGPVPVRVALDEDAFPLDDQRFTVLAVQEFLNAGVLVGDAPQTAAVWSDALDALGWARVRAIDEGDLAQPEIFDVLLLAGWNGEAATSVRDAWRRGTTVVALPADGAPLSLFQGPENAAFTGHGPSEPALVSIAAPDDELFRIFRGGEYDNPADARFLRHFTFPADALPMENATTLLAFGDAEQTPALLRWQPPDAGSLYLWNLPLGAEGGDWQSRPGFLTLFGELLLTSRARSPGSDIVAESETGSGVTFSGDRDFLPAEIRLLDEAGAPLDFASVGDGGGATVFASAAPAPGLYRWNMGETTLHFSAVNAPAVESDLRVLSPDAIAPATSVALDARQPLANLREGSPLWPWLLGLAALFLLLEGILTATLAPPRPVAVRE